MSKDIWHFPSEAPVYCFQCVFYDTASNEYHFGQYSPVFKHFRSGNAEWEHEEVQRFAFAKDIIACLDELDRTRKELEQSEICCAEWEKQALDYKAENIALSGDLERTRKALDVAIDEVTKIRVAAESVGIGFFMTAAIVALGKIKNALEQKEHFADASKMIKQKDVK